MSSSQHLHDVEHTLGDPAQAWSDFSSSCSAQDYYQGWLALQSGMIPGIVQSLLVMAEEGQRFAPVAGWPRTGNDPARLADVMENVIEERRGLLIEMDIADRYAVAYPVLIDDRLLGVVALELTASTEFDLQQAMEQLQWGTAWLELLSRRRQADEDQALLLRLKTAVDMLAVTLDRASFSEAAMTFVTELAAAAQCERVSLGFLNGRTITLQAVSHSAEVDLKMNLTRSIERVMDEALLQRCEIMYPTTDDMLICREHDALSRQQSMVSIATFPLYGQGQYYGAMTCERAADLPFTERDAEFFRAVAALVGPALESKRLNDRPVLAHAQSVAKQYAHRLLEEHQHSPKVIASAVLVVLLFFLFARGEYRLKADIVLEGAIRRAISAPFEGFINQAQVRAGDVVKQGELICTLDDRDLRLEALVKSSSFRQVEQQYQEAVSKHDRAQASIIMAQMDQARAELDLLTAKLDRTRLTAPFAGLVTSGDLSQRLGSAVGQGDILFEITPLDAYRVILKVDERRIAEVCVGQKGDLVLFSLPGMAYRFTVTKVTPIAKAEEGRNFFRVEAALETVDDALRPGMEGVGKISIDRRRLVSIWTRDMFEWIELSLWKWLP